MGWGGDTCWHIAGFGHISDDSPLPSKSKVQSPTSNSCTEPSRSIQLPTSNLSTYALGSLFCFLLFLAAHAAIILPGTGVERATFVYYVYIFLVIFAVAVALMLSSNLNFQLPISNFQF